MKTPLLKLAPIQALALELEAKLLAYIAQNEGQATNFARLFDPKNLRQVEAAMVNFNEQLNPGTVAPGNIVATKAMELLAREEETLDKCKKILAKAQEVRADLEKIKD